MFSVVSDASKVALVHLVKLLIARKFMILDAQFMNEHLKQFGATEIPRSVYLDLLSKSLELETRFV